ncbi:aldo/keto reductase [Nocardioides fonticola]|uniref:Aldo/keto reductase n=1 Tax=Nocardioides fonticola TaxID=450363 RepID=A0ABP7XDY9_9ACTN
MEYRRLGETGLVVSRLALGCMSYGEPDRGGHPWTLPPAESEVFIRRALDLGITFFDTANVYSDGSSEEILGDVLGRLVPRDEVVIATKVHGRMGPGPAGSGLSRTAIIAQCEASLRRLGVDHIDLYQIHRWDDETPIEETLEALNDLVRAGKVRYLGASSMFAWQFAKARYLAREHGWTPFVSMQNHYNLLYREEEQEMNPFCLDQGVGILPWSPLARGRLARAWDTTTDRAATDAFGSTLYGRQEDADRAVVEAVGRIAEQRGVPRATVALAWLLGRPGVTAPIVGATRQAHLDDAVAAVDLELSAEEITALEGPYVPHERAGF